MNYKFIEYENNYLIYDADKFYLMCKESNVGGTSLEAQYFKDAKELEAEINKIQANWEKLGHEIIDEGTCGIEDEAVVADFFDMPVTVELPKLNLSKAKK